MHIELCNNSIEMPLPRVFFSMVQSLILKNYIEQLHFLFVQELTFWKSFQTEMSHQTLMRVFFIKSSDFIYQDHSFCLKSTNICYCYLSLQFYQDNFLTLNFLQMYRGRLSEHDKNLDQTRLTNATRNNQNQSDALQKQIQSYTRKFEEEKRKLFRAQENNRQILKEHQNHMNDLKAVKARKYEVQVVNLNAEMKCLQISLQKGITAYNQALSKNNILKSEIDELRKDKKNQKQAFRLLAQKIEELNSSILQMDNSIEAKKNKVQKNKQQILEIKDKNDLKNNQYQKYIEMLNENQNTLRQNMKNTTSKQTTQTSDTQPIVKLRIRNLMHQNKQKIRIAELYKKSMQKIQQSFEQIKQQSGIHDLEQITKTFLKQEQQNTVIYEYIHKLTTQLEMIRQQNQALNKKIEKHTQLLDEHRSTLGGTPEEQKQKQKIQNYYAQKERHITKLHNLLNQIQPGVAAVLNIELKQGQNVLSYSNIENYLAQLEQLVNQKCQISRNENILSDLKQDFTKYSKPAPLIATDDLKDKNQQFIFEQPKLRDYAAEFWEKKRQIK